MKIRAENVFLLALIVITCIYGADTTKFVYQDFSDLSKWQLNGVSSGATNTEGKKVLRITESKEYQSGSAFVKEPQKLVSDKGFLASFSAYFSFQITNNNGKTEKDGAGADGIAFVVQTIANNVGTNGQGLGYEGIQRSLGIEFDTWENKDTVDDPNENHLGIDINGDIKSIKTLNEKARFNNGAIWYAWVDYDGDNQNLEIRYDTIDMRPVQPKMAYKINLPGLLVQENAFVGFTSATGASYSIHDILSFKFINKFQPFGYSISISATPDTIVSALDSVHLRARIYDLNNLLLSDSAKNTEWTIISNGGNPSSILKSKNGSDVLLIPEVDNSQIKVQARAVVDGQTLVDTITIYVKQKPTGSLSLSINPDTIVSVYDSVHLVASIRDSKNISQPDLAQKTKWTIIDNGGNPSSILKSDQGAVVLLIPEVAFSQIKVEAKAIVNNQTLVDTVVISIRADVPYRLSIESISNINDTSLLRHPKPVEIVTLNNSSDSVYVYAVVRDKWGNYCRMSDSIKTVWNVINGTKFISAAGIEQRKYQGEIKSTGNEGDASVEASENGLIKDTVLVKVKSLVITKIVVRDHSTGKTVDSIYIKKNESRILDVYGLINGSDSSKVSSWVLVSANWKLSDSIRNVKNMPVQGSSSWEFIPLTNGKGTLSVTSPKYSTVNEINIPVVITSGGPSLLRAVYIPSSGTNNKGVLQLTFSEPVDIDMLSKTLPQTAFKYFSSQGVSSSVILDGSTFSNKSFEQFGTTVTIQLGAGESAVMPEKDSIQLISGTVNAQGESPDINSGNKVKIEIQNGTFSVVISSNPVRLDRDLSSTLPPRILNNYKNVIGGNTKGMIIAVNSTVPLKQLNGNYGTAVVYDAVGNLVVKGLQLLKANDNSLMEYGICWNGKNRNNRNVGAGTYLIVISFTDIKEVTRSLRSKIGICQL
jgi:hypothetical protein